MSRRLRVLALLPAVVLVAPAPASAQQPVGDDPAKPLVYVFSIDGLDGDAVDPTTAPFLSRLVAGEEGNRATLYEESRAIVTAETNTNHVAMATGAFGGSSGNPGNNFAVYDPASKAACDGDLGTTATGTPEDGGNDPSGEGPGGPEVGSDPEEVDGTEPACVRAEDFFAGVERQAGARLTTAGIFGKPKLASIFAGRKVDATSFDADFLFTPCTPGDSDPPPYCEGTGRLPDGYAFTDDQVMDVVIRTVNEGVDADGARKRPNLTFVNLPNVDTTGHTTGGPDLSGAYAAAVRQVDTEIEEFVANQKAQGLWERTTLLLVSDHSMDTTRAGSTPLAPVLEANPATRGRFLVVNNGSVDMVYLRDRTAPEAEREQALAAARATVLAEQPAVDEALYRLPNSLDPGMDKTIDGAHPGWNIEGPRTGDLYVTANDGFAFDAAGAVLTGNHGNPYTTDNFLAVVSGGERVRQQRITGVRAPRLDDTLVNLDQAQNVDVGPTAMALLGCGPLRDAHPSARVLTEAFRSLGSGACAPPAAPATAPQAPGPAPGAPSGPGAAAQACDLRSGFRRFAVRPRRGGGLTVSLARSGAATGRATVDVFQQSVGRRVIGNRLVARFRRAGSFRWSGRGTRARVRDGVFAVRARVRLRGGRISERRDVVRRVGGRFRAAPAYDRAPSCGLLSTAKLEYAVFGGRNNRDVGVAFRVARQARVTVTVLRDGRTVRRFGATTRTGGVTHRLRMASERFGRRGLYTVRVEAVAGSRRQVAVLAVRRV